MRVLLSKGLVFISKPRCGSTSVRRLFSPLVSEEHGDISVDIAGSRPPFHPHITAPYLKEILKSRGVDVESLVFITTIRNPVDMLWSYYNYFVPDAQSQYNFSPGWRGEVGMSFEEWIISGHVGMNPEWKRLAPAWISTDDLSPLSLEAHSETQDGTSVIDHAFLLENMASLESWLRNEYGLETPLPHVNQSKKDVNIPNIGSEAVERVRSMFPKESEIYEI